MNNETRNILAEAFFAPVARTTETRMVKSSAFATTEAPSIPGLGAPEYVGRRRKSD